MKLQLIKTQARNFHLQVEANAGAQRNGLQLNSLEVEVRVPEAEDNKEFAICFYIDATAFMEEKAEVKCEFWAFFSGDKCLTKAFLDSHFTTVNAPAIAYPYLRNFITSSLVNAGYPALYLPTINFQTMAEKAES